MKESILLLIIATTTLILASILVSAPHSKLEQSTTEADRWYQIHKTEYDFSKSDRLTLYSNAYTAYDRVYPRYQKHFVPYRYKKFLLYRTKPRLVSFQHHKPMPLDFDFQTKFDTLVKLG